MHKSLLRSEACCIWRLHQPQLALCSSSESAWLVTDRGKRAADLTSTHDCEQSSVPGFSKEGQHAQTDGNGSSLTEQLTSQCGQLASCNLGTKACQLPMFVNKVLKTGMVAPACNPCTWKAEVGGCEFEASLGYKV